jgi:16S rRNA (adenine1518-N6/adenine1519-N6)-dimethyltransferase
VSRQPLGQHFLIKSSILVRIARAACPDREPPEREPLVIEIGPGRGALTERLLARAERVVAIEIDAGLVELLRAKFQDEPRLTVVEADALETDLSQWGAAPIAGNLPYYAATPIIEKVLSREKVLSADKVLSPGTAVSRAVFLVQKEVAARLAAGPGSRDYGYLSVQTQMYAGVERLFDVPPSAFRPPPKVDSTVVRLLPRNRAAELGLSDPARFLRFAGHCFRQKRKTLRNNLAGVYGKDAMDGWPEARKRAEELSIEELAGLYRRLAPSD